MSNVKQVNIRAKVDYNFYQEPEIARRLAAMFLNPFSGLSVSVAATQEHRANEEGGSTAIVLLYVVGQEAVSFAYLDALVKDLCKYGTVSGSATDVESGAFETRQW